MAFRSTPCASTTCFPSTAWRTSPKLILGLAGGLTIGTGGLNTGQTVVAVAVFVAIASSSVALPVLAYFAAHNRLRRPLDDLRV